jgi:hypothetical protein
MKLVATLTILFSIFITNTSAQLFEQDFTGALTTGNLDGGSTVSNSSVTSDPIYVNDPASNSQFTFLSTNNAAASIKLSGDGVLRLERGGSGTVYIVRNTNFVGPPTSAIVSFDFNAETTSGTSGGAIEFMLGQNFANSNNNPAGTDKHSVFFVNTKNPTGTPGTWGVTPVSASSVSAYTTTETITWVVNNSGSELAYTGPDASANTVANDSYDLWVGNTLIYDDQAANAADAELNNFEIRSAGGNGIYTIDNLSITEVPSGDDSTSVTDHFRTKASGNWNDIATWESSSNGLSWIDATLFPNYEANTISILTGDTVMVTDTVTVDQVTINEGSAVVVEGDPVVLTINDGADAVDMQVNGTLKVTGTAISSPGPYSISLNVGAVISFGDGGIYEHNQNGGSLPVSIWETGSTLYVNAVTNIMPGNRNQSFYNIIWDCPGQAGNYNMGFDEVTIGGDITLVNTGGGRWYLCGPPALDSAVVTVNGDITLVEGNFAAHGTGNGETTVIVNVYGDVTALSGNFSVTRGSQGGTGTTDFYLHGNLLALSNVTTQNSNPAGAKFIFAGTSPQTLAFTDVSFAGGGFPVEVASGSELNVGDSEFGGSGIFTLNSNATLGTGNEGGLDSTLKNTGTTTLDPAANYSFNGTAAQVTGALLPSSVNDLNISNAAGVTLTADVSINGELNLDDGNLFLDGNIINLGSTGTLNETDGNTVTGSSGKIIATRDLNSPAGENVGGLGAMITSSANLGSTLVERYHSSAVGGGNQGILRQFNIEPANNSALDATLRLYYDESELNGIAEANLTMFNSPDGTVDSWEAAGGTANETDNYVEVSGIADFSYWTLGDANNPIPVELTSFSATSDGRFVTLNWVTATEVNNQGWNIEKRIKNSEDNFGEWSVAGFVNGVGNATESVSYSFIDKNVTSGILQYRLKQIDFDGTFNFGQIVEVEINGPVEFAMFQNYPNPFNPETMIRFELPMAAFVNLTIYNAVGETVATLVNEQMESGVYLKSFNASKYPSGVYIYRLNAGGQIFTKKMSLIK